MFCLKRLVVKVEGKYSWRQRKHFPCGWYKNV